MYIKERNALSQLFMSTSNNNAEQQKKEQTAMKTKEELNAIREEVKALQTKLAELTEEKMKQVAGGMTPEEMLEYMRQHHLIITKDDSEFGSFNR